MGTNSAWSWEHRGLNWANNLAPPDAGHRSSTNLMVFPMYHNPFTGESVRMNTAPAIAEARKRSFMVFDQFGDRTNLLVDSSVGSLFPCPGPMINPSEDLPWTDETNASAMQEDMEEIDALLDSDSEYDCEEEEEEASTGHSPSVAVGSMENAGSSSAVYVPAKRRRVEDDLLADTASSAAEPGGGGVLAALNGGTSKRVKKERIQETVGVLRRIIPGGRGKDAATVLEEAIRYLRSLKLMAKSLGSGDYYYC